MLRFFNASITQLNDACTYDLSRKSSTPRTPHPTHTRAGFAAVFEAMRDCGKPAVGHNLAFDLAYSLHSYAEASACAGRDAS